MDIGLWHKNIPTTHELMMLGILPSKDHEPGALPETDPESHPLYDLIEYPFELPPRGNQGNEISASSMCLGRIILYDYEGSGEITISFIRDRDKKVLLESTELVPKKAGHNEYTEWYWDKALFISHWGGEIEEVGVYTLRFDTTWGNAYINFLVKDSSIPDVNLDEIDNRITATENRITTTENRIGVTESNISLLNDIIGLIDEVVDGITTEVSTINDNIASIYKNINYIDTAIDLLFKSIEDVAEFLDNIDVWFEESLKKYKNMVVSWIEDEFISIVENVLNMDKKV